ncbi:MAG TPA: hypothetical protein VMU51_26980 [Mycobacteriales bacterium]|nr:hypothetical protein [Mycobacteriales bacterium]
MCFLIPLAVVAYVAGLFVVFVLAGPPLIVLGAVGFGLFLVVGYGWVLADVLGRSTPRRPAAVPVVPSAATATQEPAYRHYLFGQALVDLWQVLRTAAGQCRQWVLTLARGINRSCFSDATHTWFTWPFGVLAWAALVFGTAGGALLVGLVAGLHVLLVGVLLGIGLTLIQLLRLADTAVLRVRRIRVTCPHCYVPIGYPSYRCPGCSTVHKDVRPGRYGVVARVCQCRTRIPTLIVLGSHRLDAVCPSCRKLLADNTGTASEVVLPVFGATAAGKTRLMLALVMALAQQIAPGDGVQFADADTRRRYDEGKAVVGSGRATRATLTALPKAYSLYLKPPGGGRRLVHLFDSAGERFVASEQLQELQFLRVAGALLFVLDPLTVPAFWDRLSAAEQARLRGERATVAPDFIFAQVLENVRGMGLRTNRVRLGVAISKVDLIRDTAAFDPPGLTSDHLAGWLTDRLEQGNLVRGLRHHFAEVRFFPTAAVATASGQVDASVITLAEWLLGSRRPNAVSTAGGRP